MLNKYTTIKMPDASTTTQNMKTELGHLGTSTQTIKQKAPTNKGGFLSNLGGLSSMANMATTVTTGLADAINEKRGMNTNKTLDKSSDILNTGSSIAKNFGAWGMLASGIIDTVNIISKLTGKNTKKVTMDEQVQASSGFSGTTSDIQNKIDENGSGFVTGIGRLFGTHKRATAKINDALDKQSKVKKILQESSMASQASANQAQLSTEGLRQRLSGGTNYKAII